MSLFVSITSIFGDLVESFIKRASEFKDSGNLFPGHGGILDRADSLAFTAPVVYFYITEIAGLSPWGYISLKIWFFYFKKLLFQIEN